MDNLTHSLAGALLGQAGLKRLSGRAMPTLILAANAPDIDGVAMLLGTQGLALRRGITHGPIAMLLLPFIVTGIVLAWNRWRPSPERVRPGALLLLASIGVLSHPALDLLNSYGIRLLEPFSSRWFYGDTLFIIDIWIWIALIAGFWLSRRREKASRSGWRMPAVAALAAVGTYVIANALISARAEGMASARLRAARLHPTMVVANPQPLAFWSRTILWRNARVHGSGSYRLFGEMRMDAPVATNLRHPALLTALGNPDVRAFLFWSRMPIVVMREAAPVLADQRFPLSMSRGAFAVPLEPPRR